MSTTRYNSTAVFLAAGAASLVLLKVISATFQTKNRGDVPLIVRSPLQEQRQTPGSKLAYPPDDFIPGARDVPSPYGTIRVYEFGPEDAQHKVLFLHGISTPCVSLLGIAEGLAKKGCRVMLMDLFGRGWSDGPADLPYDERLYTSQIFIALASSPIDWTGKGQRFALIGYSLGGALAANFTSWFPELVRNLVLIAPGGIMRKPMPWRARILYSQGWLPQSWLEAGAKRRLRTQPNVTGTQKAAENSNIGVEDSKKVAPESAVSAEVPKDTKMITARGEINMESVVNWQMDNHQGFIAALMDSMRHAPIWGQQQRWRMIGDRVRRGRELSRNITATQSRSEEDQQATRCGLDSGKVLMLMGGVDKIVEKEEVIPDAIAAFGADNVQVMIYENAGHEVPIKCADQMADDIWNTWTSST